jgi:release factor glutamine methyltransferase
MDVVTGSDPTDAPGGRLPGRAGLVDAVAARVGSPREAAWIVDHAVSVGGGDAVAVRPLALALADRRASGEPLQYVLGTWQFRTIELLVDRRVLIPRPETEQVVETALAELARIAKDRRPAGGPLVCVDLGTGSGAIALSLAVEGSPGGSLEVWATDASTDALDVARANRDRLAGSDRDAADRVAFAQGSWFEALPVQLRRRVDLIVSNPPYVSEDEYVDLDSTVRDWEPVVALVAPRGRSGVAGMADVETVVAGAGQWLRPSGALVVELAPPQAYGAIDAARRAGFSRVGTARDLAGRIRMLVAGR